MFKSNDTAPTAKQSSRVQNRRKFYQQRKRTLIHPLAFAELHEGWFRMKYTGGAYFVSFENSTKKTHAWGNSFNKAYRNFLKLFNEKYDA